MSPDQVKALLIKTFWLMSGNVDRIQAQEDMRSLTVSASSQSGEGAKVYRDQLVIETGTVVKVERVHERDEAGFQRLKELAKH